MMIKQKLFLFIIVILIAAGYLAVPAFTKPLIEIKAQNSSVRTLSAEEDNVNIPLFSSTKHFVIEATHPKYQFDHDNTAPDFSSWNEQTEHYNFSPGNFKLYDNGKIIIEAVREKIWWKDHGMRVSVDNKNPINNIHYLRVYNKINNESKWFQNLVIYMDGNTRLVPLPPKNLDSNCFGSSFVIGPAAVSSRPIAEIDSILYNEKNEIFEVHYKSGGSASLKIDGVSRKITRLDINVNYDTTTYPFITFRSMFVENGNADVDHVQWKDSSDNTFDSPIMDFEEGSAVEWFFHRNYISKHNTSAPDILIKAY